MSGLDRISIGARTREEFEDLMHPPAPSSRFDEARKLVEDFKKLGGLSHELLTDPNISSHQERLEKVAAQAVEEWDQRSQQGMIDPSYDGPQIKKEYVNSRIQKELEQIRREEASEHQPTLFRELGLVIDSGPVTAYGIFRGCSTYTDRMKATSEQESYTGAERAPAEEKRYEANEAARLPVDPANPNNADIPGISSTEVFTP
jgi:hypothetical protein